MSRKLVVLCMAAAAFGAFGAASVASAAPVLTNGAGVAVPVGTEVTGLNEGNVVLTGGFNVTCNFADLGGVVSENNGASIKVKSGNATFTGTAAGEDCTSAVGAVKPTLTGSLCFATTNIALQFEVTGCEGKPVTFDLAVTGLVTCKYEAVRLLGALTVVPADLTMRIFNQALAGEVGNPFVCPAAGQLDMSFNVFTAAGATLAVS